MSTKKKTDSDSEYLLSYAPVRKPRAPRKVKVKEIPDAMVEAKIEAMVVAKIEAVEDDDYFKGRVYVLDRTTGKWSAEEL